MDPKQFDCELQELFSDRSIRPYLDRMVIEDQKDIGTIIMATVNMLNVAFDPGFPDTFVMRDATPEEYQDSLAALEMAKKVRNLFPERPTLLEFFRTQKRINECIR